MIFHLFINLYLFNIYPELDLADSENNFTKILKKIILNL